MDRDPPSGDDHPCDDLVARQPELRRFARRLAADPHLADDLVQELALAALDPRRPPVDSPLAWMKGVLRRLFRNELRRAERRRSGEVRAARAAGADAGTSAPADGGEDAARVLASLDALAEPYRTTLLLRYVEGWPPARVAEHAGVPLRTVHTRTTRGLAQLRREVARRRPRAIALAATLAAGLASTLLFVPGAPAPSADPVGPEFHWVLDGNLPECVLRGPGAPCGAFAAPAERCLAAHAPPPRGRG